MTTSDHEIQTATAAFDKAQKFYRTIIQIEILSEEPYNFTNLSNVIYDINEGDCSGQTQTITDNQEVDAPTMAQLLIAQGSDPGFFQLTETGDDSELPQKCILCEHTSTDANHARARQWNMQVRDQNNVKHGPVCFNCTVHKCYRDDLGIVILPNYTPNK